MFTKSELFEEFIMRRCEEIAQNDEKYQETNELILELESEIKALAPEEIIKKIDEYEKLNLDLIAHLHTLFYNKAIEDIFSFIK